MGVILFIAGSLIIPVLIDSHKNPGNNIFKRAWKDVQNYKNDFIKRKK